MTLQGIKDFIFVATDAGVLKINKKKIQYKTII